MKNIEEANEIENIETNQENEIEKRNEQKKEQKTENREEKLNRQRKEFRNKDFLWRALSVLTLIIAFVYTYFIYAKMLFSDSPIRYILAVALLLTISFCIYLLPIILKINTKYTEYFMQYKDAYLKPVFEKEFAEADYKGYDKISTKEISESSILRKANAAIASDCIRGRYNDIDFARYDLKLRFKKKSATADCVFIACDARTKISEDIQIVGNSFRIGKESFEQPKDFVKYLTGNDTFDQKFSVYAKKQEDAPKLLSDSMIRKMNKIELGGPFLAMFEKDKVYLAIRRKKDPMEPPIYRSISESKVTKEAGNEVSYIKDWLELL